MPDEILIDGSRGEGGGQILRSALTLSVLTGRPFRIQGIRAGRDKPGLRPQHLAAVRALARVAGAGVEGDRLESTVLVFRPGPVRPGGHTVAVGTAGAVTLILQAMLLPLVLRPEDTTVVLTGGTHVAWSPPADHVRRVWLPFLATMGVDADLAVPRAGWYPAGGGMIRCEIRGRGPLPLAPLVLEDAGPLEAVRLRVVLSNLPMHIPGRMIARARGRLQTLLADAGLRGVDIRDETEVLGAEGPGVMLLVEGQGGGRHGGVAVLGEKGKPAERVAEEAVDEFAAFLRADATVDAFTADQLLLPCALAAGRSAYRTPAVTPHLLTNAETIRVFLDRPIVVRGETGAPGTVEVG
jgi:RNA 3'-terminal phosphate cyclase (ATP)